MQDMLVTGQIVVRNGKLAVSQTIALESSPVDFDRYYLSDVHATPDTEQYIGRGVAWIGARQWRILNSEQWIDVNGEVETEERPIPKPHTTLPTRWLDGQWQKLTKARGWVQA